MQSTSAKLEPLIALIHLPIFIVLRFFVLLGLLLLSVLRLIFEEDAEQIANHWRRFGTAVRIFARSPFVQGCIRILRVISWSKAGKPGRRSFLTFGSPLGSSGFPGDPHTVYGCGAGRSVPAIHDS